MEERVPRIRFKEFEEQWMQQTFAESFAFLKNNTLSREELHTDGLAENIHYGDILIRFEECIDPQKELLPKISNDKLIQKFKTSFLQDGDVIIADTAEDDTVGKCSEINNIGNKIIISGLHTMPCRPKGKYKDGYLGYYMNSPSYHNQLFPLMQGTKVTSISKSAISETIISFPVSETEQSMISQFLQKTTSLITLTQQKLDQLKTLKKACLEKMFPKEGETVPKIRFKGFGERWKKEKMASLFSIKRGYVLPATLTNEDQTKENPYPVYSSQTKDQGLMGYYKDWLYEDAITWTTDGANAGTVCFREGKFYCTNVCGVLLSNKVSANKMIAEALNNIAKKYVSYVGNPKLMNNVMADIEIAIPDSFLEQDNISKVFKNLDTLITLTQQKLDRLKNLKKALLDKMFV